MGGCTYFGRCNGLSELVVQEGSEDFICEGLPLSPIDAGGYVIVYQGGLG